MIERHVKTVHYLRDVLNALNTEESAMLGAIKELKIYQSYLGRKEERLDAAKKTKAAEYELRQALIDAQLIDGESRHPAVKSVTRKTAYEYDADKAVAHVINKDLIHCMAIDVDKFDRYLKYLVESGVPLPDFVEVRETVSVVLVSDLSEVAK